MRVHYSGSDLQSRRFNVNALNHEGFSSADQKGADSCLAHAFGESTGTAIWKSSSTAITRVLVALTVNTILLGMVMDLTGVGTGPVILYSVFVLTLMVIMVLIGTVARATIGTLGVLACKRALLDEPGLLFNGVKMNWDHALKLLTLESDSMYLKPVIF